MATPDHYTHDPVPWTWRKFLTALVTFAVGFVLAAAAVHADRSDTAPVCCEQPRTELDGGEPVAVICEGNTP